MKRLNYLLINVSIFALIPAIASATGTYYNGNTYQNPQLCNSASSACGNINNGGFYNNYAGGRGYGQNMNNNMGTRKSATTKKQSRKTESTSKQGFLLDIGARHEFADWGFEMKNAGSKLLYDGLRWNVIEGAGTYYFGTSTPMQITVGAKYGKQFGDISMIDDDLSTDAMWKTTEMTVDNGGTTQTEYIITGTPAISAGTSNGGSQMGFNASFGLTDFFKYGNLKMTPSVGYRYFKHKLETKNNYGLMVDVLTSDSFVNCVEVQAGEIQCSPYIGFADDTGVVNAFGGFARDTNGNLITNSDGSYIILNDPTAAQIDVGDTYYYEQSGTSHSYETEWAGPYVALDVEYAVNNNNRLNMNFEFGLPSYTSKGNQPYRWDWEHPTSVEDKAGIGDAYHLGLNGNWATKIYDNMMLSFGFTYDYYHVGDATAKTYLNKNQYEEILAAYQYAYDSDEYELTAEGLEYLQELKALKSNSWTIESKNEVESIYKSLGIRVGLNVTF